MSTNEPSNKSQSARRGDVCVVLAEAGGEPTNACLESLRSHSPAGMTIERVAASAATVNEALARLAPADVVIVTEPCRVSDGWLQRLAAAAHADTNNASASALTLGAGELPLPQTTGRPGEAAADLDEATTALAGRSLSLRPRLSRAVGPCVYVRRDALELVGPLDERLDLRDALELDLSQRCMLAGMTHVAADDVVVERLSRDDSTAAPEAQRDAAELPAPIRERYPYLAETPLADSAVLGHALRSAAPPPSRLAVTLDARALDGAMTGTQVHVLELILALARTEALALRLLVRAERIDRETRELLAGLPAVELLAAETLADGSAAERSLSTDALAATAKSTVFHRPQQTFSPGDVQVALALGERFVISQLDLIAYRNPGYFADAATWEDFRAASRHGLSAAERVVVFSEHTRAELLADALVEEQRIRVVPPGLDHRPRGEPRRPAAFDAEGSERTEAGYLLCLGTDFRHKNRLFALRLLAALRERHGWHGALVLAGTHVSPGSSEALEREYVREHPELERALISLGPVDEAAKAWLVANAAALVYPSVYEGFGLVPFESALAGVPCVFAPYASLAEAAPAGAASIVPWDEIASADATHELLADERTRQLHVGAIAERARTFTWDTAAAAMVEVYEEAALAPVRDSATLSRDLVEREARLSVQHDAEARQLTGEREHAKRMYDELNAEVGFGLGLIGPNGSLPENVQRVLLALSARPAISRPLFGTLTGVFVLVRAVVRPLRKLARPRG